MGKQYKIRAGFSFIDHKANVIRGGETVTLEDDVAASQLHKLELVQPAAPAKPASKAKPAPTDEAAPVVEQEAAADATGEQAADKAA